MDTYSAGEVTDNWSPRPVDQSRFGTDPQSMIWQLRKDAFAIPPKEIAEIQLTALRGRFEELVQKIPVLKRLADEQGVTKINRIEDGAQILFKHSVYKSYPFSLIEKNRFDRLTAWLDNLTVYDLSGLDASRIETIDDWLDMLYRDAPIRIIHSTGTSGKLSFLPRGKIECDLNSRSFVLGFEWDTPLEGLEDIPMIVPQHRHGFSAYNAVQDAVVKFRFHGDESMLYALFPGRFSADILSLGGRLKAAESKGSLGRDAISPVLLARRDQFIKEQASAPEQRREFFRNITQKLRGRRVSMTGNWTMLYELSVEGLAAGSEGVFAPDSLLVTAGGTKGKVLPPDHKEVTKRFLGIDKFVEGYGMSETVGGLFQKCEHGHYHAPPHYVLYLLDPATGEPYPRTGTQTGRLGIIDLLAGTYWAGLLTGDEVTLTWDQPCPCGRTGAYLGSGIRRFSEKEGGDDKITCAGAPEAHDNALAFLSDFE